MREGGDEGVKEGEEQVPRQSGSLEWRESRGEMGQKSKQQEQIKIDYPKVNKNQVTKEDI